MSSVSKYINFAKFQISRLGGYSFDADSVDFHTSQENDYFLKRIQVANRYLEFGAGASTIAAASKGIKTVTIETDPLFLGAVAESLFNKKIDQHVTLIIRPIGLLGPWGSPFISLFSPVTKNRSRLFGEYSEPPLFGSVHGAYLPDLILIDGKFRVACALKLLDYFRRHEHTDYEIIFDDYVGRKQYHILESFFDVGSRMREFVTFHHKANIDSAELRQAIKQFELIPD